MLGVSLRVDTQGQGFVGELSLARSLSTPTIYPGVLLMFPMRERVPGAKIRFSLFPETREHVVTVQGREGRANDTARREVTQGSVMSDGVQFGKRDSNVTCHSRG
ncbi:hypothetical protein NHX12_022845 [Muraenolepis orangiensis]|uniref:Uncharacterized protein n=1 Tax=Muraenolepis orangiensis TaxID=630683 RepID=A0A9Q0EP29_9TELE|nr:hypothetical protein NHX12_022845 [Muraenolepis orangiensis]